jgi:Transcriptional regulator
MLFVKGACMRKKTDLRILKTKKLIIDSFYELVNEKGFEKVTINDITTKSMINRATFYLHYEDKYNLLSSLEDEALDDIKEIFSVLTPDYLESHVDDGIPYPHIVKLLTYIEENQTFFRMIMSNNISYSFERTLGDLLKEEIYDTAFPALKTDIILKKYGIHIAVAIFSSIVNQWIITGMKEPVDEIALLIAKITTNFIHSKQK